jgi:hypothetical protein
MRAASRTHGAKPVRGDGDNHATLEKQ